VGSFKSRRDATRVIYEILSIARAGATKTQIVYKVNLNSRLARGYVEFLVEKGLLIPCLSQRGGTIFDLSLRGEQLLRSLIEVEKLIQLFPVVQTILRSSQPLAHPGQERPR